mgnify:CR=1 FL=1
MSLKKGDLVSLNGGWAWRGIIIEFEKGWRYPIVMWTMTDGSIEPSVTSKFPRQVIRVIHEV